MANDQFGQWAIVKAEGERGVAVFRVRTDQPPDASLYPTNVSIRWAYQGDSLGFPTKSDVEVMARFEDAVADLTGTQGLSQLVLVTTGFDLREWEFYVSDYERFMQRFNALLEGSPTFPLEIQYTHDPSWLLWHRVRDRAQETPESS